jgi:protocatechuate 3,4-dioxygenase beta subunit
VHFRDDPRLQASTRQPAQRGGGGVAEAIRDANGTWQATRDIVLGKNIAGYETCGG